MEKKRPQLSLAELYQLKWILGGFLALLSAWTVLYMEVEAALWPLLTTLAVPLVVRWPALTLRVPRWVHMLAFPLFVALFAADYYFNREPLPAMIRLALMLVFYRSVTARRRREDLQLIVLGLFLVVVAGVLSVSLAFAVQIVVFTACTLAFLMVINLIDSAEAGQPVSTAAGALPPQWMRMEFRRLARRVNEATDWRVALMASGLFGGVVGLSALLFFALPRFEISNNFFLDNLIKGRSRTGFSETVRFGDVTDIRQDTSVALRVEVSDTRAIPGDPYWRMLVLDTYKDGVFGVSRALARQMPPQRVKSAQVTGGAWPRLGDAVWTFYLEPGTTRYLPLLGGFHQLQFNGGPQDYAINDELRMVRLEKTPTKMFAYRVEGMRHEREFGPAEVAQKRLPLELAPEIDEEIIPVGRSEAAPAFLRLSLDPADSVRLSEWARQIDAVPGDARKFAQSACAWLAGTHAYSLHMTLPPGEGDQLVRWIGSDQPGHCELFAGAFILLARSAGYPARMVTGFRGGTWNPASGHLSIRNSDAHAWCEILDRSAGRWVRVDPTPGAASPAAQAQTTENVERVLQRMQDTGWSSKLDGLRMFWYRRIVDFDHNSQAELARNAKGAIESYLREWKYRLSARAAALAEWFKRPWDVARLAAWLLIVAASFGLVIGWRLIGRGLWLRVRSGMAGKGADPVRKEAGRWLRRLGESDRQNAEDAGLKADLERLRYGPRAGWPNPQSAFRAAKRALRR